MEVKKRIFDIIQYVNKEHNGENVLLVTHMDPIKAVLSNVLSLKPESIFELIVANASLTIFNDFDGKLSLKAINVMGPNRFDQEW